MVDVPKFQARKNAGKPRVATLVPLGALEAIAHAAEVGPVKYWKDGYRDDGGYSLSQCLDSCVRHAMSRSSGEKYDVDSSVMLEHPVDHLHGAIWNLSTACENLRLYGDRNDDLWKGPGTARAQLSIDAAELIQLRSLLTRTEATISKYKDADRARAEKLIAHLASEIATLEGKLADQKKEQTA